jgi:hypothetical protein
MKAFLVLSIKLKVLEKGISTALRKFIEIGANIIDGVR